jgi:hypothetical protein
MRKIAFFILLLTLSLGCKESRVDGVYRYYMGRSGNYVVWIIDGSVVRAKIYKEFLYGGNEQRYIFNPKGEIWIDNAISCEEYDLTLAHELNERHLMAKFGWTYQAAHDSSLRLEQVIRHKNLEASTAHEAELKKVSVLDSYNIKEIKSLPDSISLKDIYRIPEGIRDGISIWVVDGYMIRKNIYPDFGFSGNDLVYHFIPPKEIWIDGQISCEETEYSIALEMMERKEMTEGKSYSDAYEDAVQASRQSRLAMVEKARLHPPVALPDSLQRDAGVIDPGEK